MTIQNLSGHSKVSSIHLDQLFSKLVKLKHVKHSWWVNLVRAGTVLQSITP